jgi:hypothetical protein
MLPPGSNCPGHSFGFHAWNSAGRYLKLNQKRRLIAGEMAQYFVSACCYAAPARLDIDIACRNPKASGLRKNNALKL